MFLRFILAMSIFSGLCASCGCSAPGIDAQIAHLHAAERPARDHALDGLLDHALGETALEDLLRGALLDVADIAGVLVIDLLLALAAGQHRMRGVDDDDVVAAIDMGRVGREVLAAQAHGDERGEATDDQTLGVDQRPTSSSPRQALPKTFSWCIREMENRRAEARAELRGFLENSALARQRQRCKILAKTIAYKYGAIIPRKPI